MWNYGNPIGKVYGWGAVQTHDCGGRHFRFANFMGDHVRVTKGRFHVRVEFSEITAWCNPIQECPKRQEQVVSVG